MKKLLTLLLVAVMVCTSLVACKQPTPPVDEVTYDLDSAVAYVESLYQEDLSVTAVDYPVVSQVMVAGVTYQVDWSVDSDKVTVGEPANGTVTIGVDEKSPEEVSYKLTATVKAGDGTSKTVAFNLTVPKYDVNSHADYMAAKQDDMLTVEGIVVAINSKEVGNKYNHLFLADTSVTGGYYCYSVTQDPIKDLGIEVGMTVSVTGPMAPYSGMQEIKGGQVAIIDKTIKQVAPVDITEAFTAGSDLGAYVGLPVVIKGVEIGAQELEKDTSQYLFFSIGEKQGYVRTYVTDFPTTLKADDKAGIDADHAAHFGYKADAAGILILYNGAPYLIPMSTTPFTNYEEVIKTPADKVEAELGDLKLSASFSSDAVVDLLLKGKYYDDVTLAWATDDTTGAATIADGKLTIVVPDDTTTVNVTVTATCGDVTNTKTFAIQLSKKITPIKDLLTLGAAQESYTEAKYLAGGIIIEVQNTTYGNIVIKDENGDSILIYGTYLDGKKYGDAEAKPVVGDYVVLAGVVGQYKGTPQLKNADILSFTAPSALKDAVDAGAAKEHNAYTENKFLVTGKVTEITSDKYGNMYIADAEGNTIYIYGLYDQAGARYDGMATKPAVGDTITVLSTAGKYNDVVQLKNATLVAIATGEGGTQGDDEPDAPAAPQTLTIPAFTEIALAQPNMGATTTEKYIVTGTITEIANTQWGNMYIQDAEGNKLYIYGLYSADGSTRYDALESQPQVGDTITLIGVASNYNGAQMKSAWIYDPNAIKPETPDTPATPATPALPTELTAIPAANTIGVAKDHNTFTTEKYLVKGVITEIKSTVYGNLYIEDELGNKLYVYGLYDATGANRFDVMNPQPKVGDTITVAGILGQYNGNAQMKNGWVVELVAGEGTDEPEAPADPVEPDPTPGGVLSISDANAIGGAKAHNSYTTDKYTVTGKISDIQNDMWGNLYIKDAKGETLYIYGLYSADGSARYDAMDPQPQIGDTITVVGILGQYNGAPQMKNGWVIDIVAATEEDEPFVSPFDCITIPSVNDWIDRITAKDTMPISEALTLADDTEVVLKGVVTAVGNKGAWNSKYGNMNVTISDGTGSILVYRVYAQVNVGDEIIVTGVMDTYSGSRQIAQGATVELVDSKAKEVTIAEACALADGAYVAVTGTIKSIDTKWSTSFYNITVTLDDGTGTLQAYRMTFDVQAGASLKKGDSITVYGIMDTYKGTRQIAAGSTAVLD